MNDRKAILRYYFKCLIDLEQFPIEAGKKSIRTHVCKKFNITTQTLCNYLPEKELKTGEMKKLRSVRSKKLSENELASIKQSSSKTIKSSQISRTAPQIKKDLRND